MSVERKVCYIAHADTLAQQLKLFINQGGFIARRIM